MPTFVAFLGDYFCGILFGAQTRGEREHETMIANLTIKAANVSFGQQPVKSVRHLLVGD